MSILWRSIRAISALLEPAERQAVIGDIEERGVNLRALLDLSGLVLLRQLQTWKSRRSWLLAPCLGLSAFVVIGNLLGFAWSLTYFPWPETGPYSRPRLMTILFAECASSSALAWAVGYFTASLWRQVAPAILLPVVGIAAWLLHGSVQPPLLTAATVLVLFGAIPVALGLRHAWREFPVRPSLGVLLVVLCLPFVYSVRNANPTSWIPALTAIVSLWPVVYALSAHPRVARPN